MESDSPDHSRTSSPTSSSHAPIARRTILTGAALTVPAVVATTSTPAVAASGATLGFSQSAYSAQGCATLSGVRVIATSNGSPVPGTVVTVSLADGFSFVAGGTTSTGTTGSDGSFTVPAISVPPKGANSTVTATSSSASTATALLQSTSAATPSWLESRNEQTTTSIPAGSTPVAASFFLTSDGQLLNGDGGALLATNVDTFGQMYRDIPTNSWRLPLKKTDGSTTFLLDGVENATTGVPAGSTPIVSGLFLTPGGRIVNGGNGGMYDITDVSSFGQTLQYDGNGNWRLPVRKTNGEAAYVESRIEHAVVGVPSNSTPVASSIFLSSDGRLIDGGSGSVYATGVASCGQIYRDIPTGSWRLPLKKTDGTTSYIQDGTEVATTGVPSGSMPSGSGVFLTPAGRFVNGATGGMYDITDVGSFGQWFQSDSIGNWRLPVLKRDPSC